MSTVFVFVLLETGVAPLSGERGVQSKLKCPQGAFSLSFTVDLCLFARHVQRNNYYDITLT